MIIHPRGDDSPCGLLLPHLFINPSGNTPRWAGIFRYIEEIPMKNKLMQYATKEEIISCAISLLDNQIRESDVLCSPKQTREFLTLQLKDELAEVFCVLFLDNRHRVISFDRMFNGTIDGASVYPREVVRSAINHNASAVIFAHNHPSGMADPSSADEKITKRLKDALALIDVRVLDHFVVGEEVVSMAERGLM